MAFEYNFEGYQKILQNVCKNLIINMIFETQCFFNIIFIQEPSWSFIYLLSSLKNSKGKDLVGVLNHPNLITFSRNTTNISDSSRVITYINIRLISLYFSSHNNIFNYWDISCISFVNCSLVYFLINIYSDSSQLALKYLKDIEVDINDILIMTGDFNIRDCSWNLNFCFHSIYKDVLLNIANSFYLEMFESTNHVLTKYSNNQQELDSVINLMFFRLTSLKYDNHSIYPD